LCFGSREKKKKRTRQTHKRFMFMVMVACKHGVINGYVRKREYKRRGGEIVTYTKGAKRRTI
jgi:hypothetical protein